MIWKPKVRRFNQWKEVEVDRLICRGGVQMAACTCPIATGLLKLVGGGVVMSWPLVYDDVSLLCQLLSPGTPYSSIDDGRQWSQSERRAAVGMLFQFPERHFLGSTVLEVGCCVYTGCSLGQVPPPAMFLRHQTISPQLPHPCARLWYRSSRLGGRWHKSFTSRGRGWPRGWKA